MQQQAAQAYQTIAKKTINQRDLEANLLSEAAARLQQIKENWETADDTLRVALKHNRAIWNVFLGSVTSDESELPRDVRENVANLGLFVINHSLKIEVRPEPQRLDVLININREIAAGLRAA